MNRQKLEQLVHYISYRCEDTSVLGKTKLNKVLFFADFQQYVDTGESITGENYIKYQYGPVSEHLDEIVEGLEEEGMLATRRKHYENYFQDEFISLREPNLEDFTADEIKIVEDMIQIVCYGHTARSISDFSHTSIWEAADIGEEIPYEAGLLFRLGEIGPEDMEWAQSQLAARAN